MAAKSPTIAFVVKAADDNVLKWPCTISVPVSGGTFQDQVLTARFKVLPMERLQYFFPTPEALLEAMRQEIATANAGVDAAALAAVPAKRGNDGLLDEALLGFEGLKTSDGQAVSDTDAIAQLRPLTYVVDGLVRGYYEMLGRRLPKN